MIEGKLAAEIGCRRDELRGVLRHLEIEAKAFHQEAVFPCLLPCVRQVIYLRIAGIALSTIVKLWETEQKLIELLHGDSLGSETWMIDSWAEKGKRRQRLMLSHYALGADLASVAMQPSLNFAGDDGRELFAGKEMGEDVMRVLQTYLARRQKLIRKLRQAQPLLQKTAQWAKKFGGTVEA
jgi:hypothetical protein